MGEYNGRKGKGFSGTNIKDTWTKPRWGWKPGREVGMAGVGVEWWGVYSDNCN